MGLDALLAKMERRAADTPDTPCYPQEVTAKAAPIKACTLVTSVTPEKTTTAIAKPETLLDWQREARRQKVIAMLEAAPDLPRAIHVDDDNDPNNNIVCVAVRACQQTCEMLIPRAKYDPWTLLKLLMRHGRIVGIAYFFLLQL